MITTTVLLVLALGAPTEDAVSQGTSIAAMDNRAETLVLQALETVNQRISVLEELRRRRDAGETISLTALRTVSRSDTTSDEALLRERARIEELKDEIRVAVATRRANRPGTPSIRRPEETPVEASTAPTPPVAEETPARDPAIVPTVVGEPEIRLADARYQAGDYAAALGIYEKAVATGKDTWARLRQARCLERLDRAQDAREAYESLVRDHPDDRWAQAARWSLRLLAMDRGETPEEEDAR